MRKVILLIVFLFLSTNLYADVVCLKNGNTLEGIILKEDENSIELEVFINASISFSRQDVEYIQHQSNRENYQIRQNWFKVKEERQVAELQRQQFEAEQMGKGLVKYKNRWIAKEKKHKLEMSGYINELLEEKRRAGEAIPDQKTEMSDLARVLLAKLSWNSRQSQHFLIYYQDVIQSKTVADKAEYHYEKIIYDLNYKKEISWPDKCLVFVIQDKEQWQRHLSTYIKSYDLIGGLVPGGQYREIYLCGLSLPYLAVTFPHELTHLILREFAEGKEIPLWLNEGLAVYESSVIGLEDELLREKLSSGTYITIPVS